MIQRNIQRIIWGHKQWMGCYSRIYNKYAPALCSLHKITFLISDFIGNVGGKFCIFYCYFIRQYIPNYANCLEYRLVCKSVLAPTKHNLALLCLIKMDFCIVNRSANQNHTSLSFTYINVILAKRTYHLDLQKSFA